MPHSLSVAGPEQLLAFQVCLDRSVPSKGPRASEMCFIMGPTRTISLCLFRRLMPSTVKSNQFLFLGLGGQGMAFTAYAPDGLETHLSGAGLGDSTGSKRTRSLRWNGHCQPSQ